MSCNRGSTGCKCRFWHFFDDEEVAQSTAGLLTLEEYFRLIGRVPDDNAGHGYGHGFPDHLNGDVARWWRAPDGGGANYPIPGGVLVETPYHRIERVDWYRWRRLTCPFCLASYAGWYAAWPCPTTEPWKYVLTDTSFWSSFNDEPGSEEVAATRSVEPLQLAAAWNEWLARSAT